MAESIVIAGRGPTGTETGGAGDVSKHSPGLVWAKTKGTRHRRESREYFSSLGVKIIKNARVEAATPDGAGTGNATTKATLTLEGDKTLDADLYIPTIGVTPNTGFIDPALLVAGGQVDTNASLRVDKAGPRVYAIGDAASVGRPAIHLIMEAVPILCANIKRDLLLAAGKPESTVGEDRIYKEDKRETQLVPIGKSWGVGAAMGYQLPSFAVSQIKGRDYFLGTAGSFWGGKKWEKES